MLKVKNLNKKNKNANVKIPKKTKEQNEKTHQIKALIKNGLVKCPTVSKKNEKKTEKLLQPNQPPTEIGKPPEEPSELILYAPKVANEIKNLGEKKNNASYDNSIYVKNLPKSTNVGNIAELFDHCGEIICITFPSKSKVRFIHNPANAKSAYVVFKSILGAEKALELNGTPYEGRTLSVEKYCKSSTYSPELTVFVSNFKYYKNDQKLHEKFSSCGDIDFIRILNKTDNIGYRGKAFVCYKNVDSVDLALELDGTMLDENTINVSKYSIIKLGGPESKRFKNDQVEANENISPEVSKDRFKEIMELKGAKYLKKNPKVSKAGFEELMQQKGSKYIKKSLEVPKESIKVATKPKHPESNPLTTVFVGNLTNSATDEQLQNLFSSCGDISYARTLKNRDNTGCRGTAFVCFKNADAVDLALKLDGTMFDETPIKVRIYSMKIQKIKQMKNEGKIKEIRPKFTKHIPEGGKKVMSGFRGIKSPFQFKTKNINTKGSSSY